MISKQELRKQVLAKRDALTIEQRKKKSNEIAQRLFVLPMFQKSDVVLLYAAFRSEVDTAEIFEAAKRSSKRIYYPKVLGDEMEFYRVEADTDLEAGRWGIFEPKAEEEKRYVPKEKERICVVMPGAVWDNKGNRIGYGKGYYDKYFSKYPEVYKIAIAFSMQIVPEIQADEFDVKADCVITE